MAEDYERLATWTFSVFEGEHGGVKTTWNVVVFDDDEAVATKVGEVEGNLYDAIQAAVDAHGYIFPFVPDPDLQAMSGGLE